MKRDREDLLREENEWINDEVFRARIEREIIAQEAAKRRKIEEDEFVKSGETICTSGTKWDWKTFRAAHSPSLPLTLLVLPLALLLSLTSLQYVELLYHCLVEQQVSLNAWMR
jgi:hypothetical protein